MESIFSCAFLAIDGDFPDDVMESLLKDLENLVPALYRFDLCLPTFTETSEEAAWLAIRRIIAIEPSPKQVQVIVHRYSPTRKLVAVACPVETADRGGLYAVLKDGLGRLCKDHGTELQFGSSHSSLEVGTTVDLRQSDCEWDRKSEPPETFIAFLSASVVCQYLLTGHATIGLDVLFPRADEKNGASLCSLHISTSLERTIGGIRNEIHKTLRSPDFVLYGHTPESTVVVLQSDSPLPELECRRDDGKIKLLAVEVGGPWLARFSLPSLMFKSRVECIGIFTPSAQLLPQLYAATDTRPDWSIRKLAHVLVTPANRALASRGRISAQNNETAMGGDDETVRSRPRITVATLNFGELPYAVHSRAINQAYCARHGYLYRTIVPPTKVERHSVWYKVRGISSLLEGSDFVMFLDADAYFIDHEQSIESLITSHMGDSALMLGTDRRDKDFTFSDEEGNSGVFLIRNCLEGFEILEEWWRAAQRPDLSEWLWRWPVEQAVLNNHLRKGRYANAIRLIHYSWMNGQDGVFIRHLVGTPEEERLAVFRRARAATLGSLPDETPANRDDIEAVK